MHAKLDTMRTELHQRGKELLEKRQKAFALETKVFDLKDVVVFVDGHQFRVEEIQKRVAEERAELEGWLNKAIDDKS